MNSLLKRRVLIFMAFVVVLAAMGIGWGVFTWPHIYRHVKSPDGGWSVTVLRQRVAPYVEGVDVIVRIHDGGGTLVYKKRIDSRDLWEDVDERYPVVEITNERVRIGPGWRAYKGTPYFELDRAEAFAEKGK